MNGWLPRSPRARRRLTILAVVAPVLALLFFVRARVGPGLQAAALSGLLWALVALIAWAGLRG